jgi:hypothetical protein
MNKFKERFQKGKIEIIMGIIMLLVGIIITFFLYDRNTIQSSGLYTLMFAPIIAGTFFIIMGFFKK